MAGGSGAEAGTGADTAGSQGSGATKTSAPGSGTVAGVPLVRRALGLVLFAAVAVVFALRDFHAPNPTLADHTHPPPAFADLALVPFLEGLEGPIHLASPPGEPDRLVLVERSGRLRVIDGGKLRKEPLLDISHLVSTISERGLLSVAFHPRYPEVRRIFFYYNDAEGTSRIAEASLEKGEPLRLVPDSMKDVITIRQPYANHNGGHILFGKDGYLYIPLGDGGSGGDPHDEGQNPKTHLGSILRIDVDSAAPYAIPDTNPFKDGAAGAPEVWAYGVRNPWRCAFDRETGDLYVADVGQGTWEEVSVISFGAAPGQNLGWDNREGLVVFPGGARLHGSERLDPVVVYGRDVGASVTGGCVYRGKAIPALVGHYLYADFVTGMIRSFRYTAAGATDRYELSDLLNPKRRVVAIASFAEDGHGELYVLSLAGTIYKLVRRGS